MSRTSALVAFHYESKEVRTATDESGNPWFVAKDVCCILGLESVSKALTRIPDNHKGVNPIPTLGGIQKLSVVDEPGLYRLILRSDKPQAEPFMEWVTSEVLPQIRKTGCYHPSDFKPRPGRLQKPSAKQLGLETPPGQKWCPGCQKFHPFSHFNQDNGIGRGGLQTYCVRYRSQKRRERNSVKATQRIIEPKPNQMDFEKLIRSAVDAAIKKHVAPIVNYAGKPISSDMDDFFTKSAEFLNVPKAVLVSDMPMSKFELRVIAALSGIRPRDQEEVAKYIESKAI